MNPVLKKYLKWAAMLVASVVGATVVFQNCSSSGGGGSSGNVTATGTAGTMVVVPMAPVIGLGQQVTFDVSGGTPPYTYAVTSGAGTFSSNIYTAPEIVETDDIEISDSAGHDVTTTVSVVTSVEVTCTGSYDMTAGGSSGTLTISEENNSGAFAGTAVLGNVSSTISGLCSYNSDTQQYSITFTRSYAGGSQVYTGSMLPLNSESDTWQMNGTYSQCPQVGNCNPDAGNWQATSL